MATSAPQRVSITIQPVPGHEPDSFSVAFQGADGVTAAGGELTLPAGKVGTWEFAVTAAAPVPAGGGFLFQRHTFLLSHRIQDYNPQGRDYVTLEARTSAALRLVVNSARQSHQPGFAQVLVERGQLAPGDGFVLRVGDRRWGGAGSEVYDATTLARIVVAVDRAGGGTYRELAASPARALITSEPEATLLRVLGPSTALPGEPFALHLVAFDAHHNVCEQYQGDVRLALVGGARGLVGVDGLPEVVRLGRDDKGSKILTGVRLAAPGLYRLAASDAAHGLQALSNPIDCRPSHERRLLWGQFHCHSWGDTSMALMDDPNFKLHPAARHRQARQVGRLDFASPGPAGPPNQEDRPELWLAHQQAFRENDEPGTYVPFLAFETHPRPGGDRNVVFRDWSDTTIPTFSPMDTVMALYSEREDVFLETHVGGGPPDWEAYPTRHEPLLEIASGHGVSEWVLQRALRHGHRPAIIGSEDTHLPTLGAPMQTHTFFGRFAQELNMRDTGLGSGPSAAVWAERCERQAIWQAVRERRTYATTGARIILHLDVNGLRPGAEGQIEAPAQVRIRANACAPVERIDLIRGDRCLQSWQPGTLDVDLSHLDPQPLRDGAYYVRLRQVDGEYAWSTPVWTGCAQGQEYPDPSLPLWNAHESVELSTLRPNAAETHEAALRRYLEVEEDLTQFHDLTPVRLLDEITGRSALFYAYYGPERFPVSLRWYYEFEMPKIHVDWGWHDFGPRATPLSCEHSVEREQWARAVGGAGVATSGAGT